MQFHLAFTPNPLMPRIRHADKLLLCGSCFTEQMGAKLRQYKFRTLENPNGILFNPVSIATAVNGYIENKQYSEADLFLQDETWGSWDHHTRFSALTAEESLAMINTSQNNAHHFLKNADWLLLTLGSSFVYERGEGSVVANCHKLPADKFRKRLLPVQELLAVLDEMIHRLREFNPGLQIIFTISPVRHLRDGFVENNRSKAALIQAVHQLVDKFGHLHYFPAYELVIDDLRDYRFYAEDMVHPNFAATQYVWEKFMATAIEENAHGLMKEIGQLNAARNHKAFNPGSVAHQAFLKKNLEKAQYLHSMYPYLDLADETAYFSHT